METNYIVQLFNDKGRLLWSYYAGIDRARALEIIKKKTANPFPFQSGDWKLVTLEDK
jgi:hypothetical protein